MMTIRIAHPTIRLRRRAMTLWTCAVLLLAPTGAALATGIEIIESPAADVIALAEPFPAYLLTVHAPPAAHAPTSAEKAAEAKALAEIWTFAAVLEWPGFSPLEVEQNVRVNKSEMLVKFRAPGGRMSFATVELVF